MINIYPIIILVSGILLGTFSAMNNSPNVFAQGTQAPNATETTINFGSDTPVTVYLTQAGGFWGGYENTMFDSNSMQKVTIESSNSPPLFEKVSEKVYNQLVNYIANTTNFEFFSLESSPYEPCPDCQKTLLTISMPTPGGTVSNTVYYNNYDSKEEVPVLVRNIVDLLNLENFPQINIPSNQ